MRATIVEYDIPTARPLAHSLVVDTNSGMVWFSEYSAVANKVGRFDPETEKFEEFLIPVPGSIPHTGSVSKDGTFVVALNGRIAAKMAAVDRAGQMTVYEWPEKPQGTHTAALDPRGNFVWFTAEDEVWSLDVKTKQFRAYKNPVPETFPEGSQAALEARPGDRPRGDGYDIAVDSKGIPWFSQLDLGTVVRVDPVTGEMKSYHTPEMRSARGVAIDAQDNVWFADYFGNQIGKLDPKTGAVKLYQTPSPNATPYGVAMDHRRGYVWYADTYRNSIARLDPKTEQFIEYLLPTRNQGVRFFGIDPQGRAWYSGFWTGKVGVIDPDGESKALVSEQR